MIDDHSKHDKKTIEKQPAHRAKKSLPVMKIKPTTNPNLEMGYSHGGGGKLQLRNLKTGQYASAKHVIEENSKRPNIKNTFAIPIVSPCHQAYDVSCTFTYLPIGKSELPILTSEFKMHHGYSVNAQLYRDKKIFNPMALYSLGVEGRINIAHVATDIPFELGRVDAGLDAASFNANALLIYSAKGFKGKLTAGVTGPTLNAKYKLHKQYFMGFYWDITCHAATGIGCQYMVGGRFGLDPNKYKFGMGLELGAFKGIGAYGNVEVDAQFDPKFTNRLDANLKTELNQRGINWDKDKQVFKGGLLPDWYCDAMEGAVNDAVSYSLLSDQARQVSYHHSQDTLFLFDNAQYNTPLLPSAFVANIYPDLNPEYYVPSPWVGPSHSGMFNPDRYAMPGIGLSDGDHSAPAINTMNVREDTQWLPEHNMNVLIGGALENNPMDSPMPVRARLTRLDSLGLNIGQSSQLSTPPLISFEQPGQVQVNMGRHAGLDVGVSVDYLSLVQGGSDILGSVFRYTLGSRHPKERKHDIKGELKKLVKSSGQKIEYQQRIINGELNRLIRKVSEAYFKDHPDDAKFVAAARIVANKPQQEAKKFARMLLEENYDGISESHRNEIDQLQSTAVDCYINQKNIDGGLSACGRLNAIDSNNPDTQVLFARLYASKGEVGKLKGAIKKADQLYGEMLKRISGYPSVCCDEYGNVTYRSIDHMYDVKKQQKDFKNNVSRLLLLNAYKVNKDPDEVANLLASDAHLRQALGETRYQSEVGGLAMQYRERRTKISSDLFDKNFILFCESRFIECMNKPVAQQFFDEVLSQPFFPDSAYQHATHKALLIYYQRIMCDDVADVGQSLASQFKPELEDCRSVVERFSAYPESSPEDHFIAGAFYLRLATSKTKLSTDSRQALYDKALSHHKVFLEKCDAHLLDSDVMRYISLQNIAWIYHHEGNFDKKAEYLNACEKLLERQDDDAVKNKIKAAKHNLADGVDMAQCKEEHSFEPIDQYPLENLIKKAAPHIFTGVNLVSSIALHFAPDSEYAIMLDRFNSELHDTIKLTDLFQCKDKLKTFSAAIVACRKLVSVAMLTLEESSDTYAYCQNFKSMVTHIEQASYVLQQAEEMVSIFSEAQSMLDCGAALLAGVPLILSFWEARSAHSKKRAVAKNQLQETDLNKLYQEQLFNSCCYWINTGARYKAGIMYLVGLGPMGWAALAIISVGVVSLEIVTFSERLKNTQEKSRQTNVVIYCKMGEYEKAVTLSELLIEEHNSEKNREHYFFSECYYLLDAPPSRATRHAVIDLVIERLELKPEDTQALFLGVQAFSDIKDFNSVKHVCIGALLNTNDENVTIQLLSRIAHASFAQNNLQAAEAQFFSLISTLRPLIEVQRILALDKQISHYAPLKRLFCSIYEYLNDQPESDYVVIDFFQKFTMSVINVLAPEIEKKYAAGNRMKKLQRELNQALKKIEFIKERKVQKHCQFAGKTIGVMIVKILSQAIEKLLNAYYAQSQRPEQHDSHQGQIDGHVLSQSSLTLFSHARSAALSTAPGGEGGLRRSQELRESLLGERSNRSGFGLSRSSHTPSLAFNSTHQSMGLHRVSRASGRSDATQSRGLSRFH